jgi:hypothetical protein
MKKLQRSEMKKILGGKVTLVGWEKNPNGNCYCDFYIESNIVGQQPFYLCHQQCNIAYCNMICGTVLNY